MACRNIRFRLEDQTQENEWVPMALREATCALRQSNPEKWNQALRCEGVDVDDDNIDCLHNHDSSFHECPLHVSRTAAPQPQELSEAEEQDDESDEARNEHGYPLIL